MHWKEPYNWTKHQNKMWGEGAEPEHTRDEKLDPHYVYFVRTCGFDFEFHSLDQLKTCLDFYSRKIQPTSRTPSKDLHRYGGDHWEVQRWYERLPMKLLDNHRRPSVVKALTLALIDFTKDSGKSLRSRIIKEPKD